MGIFAFALLVQPIGELDTLLFCCTPFHQAPFIRGLFMARLLYLFLSPLHIAYAMQKGKNQIPLNQALAIIKSGKFFSCEFTKRTTGETRVMLARVGVKKYLKGTGARYSFSEKGLIPVYDLLKREYRSIPIENITKINKQPIHHGEKTKA